MWGVCVWWTYVIVPVIDPVVTDGIPVVVGPLVVPVITGEVVVPLVMEPVVTLGVVRPPVVVLFGCLGFSIAQPAKAITMIVTRTIPITI